MKYLVMECHFSYAVVLDEEGRFLTVANMNYKVGDTVTEVIELAPIASEPGKAEKPKRPFAKWFMSAGIVAACLLCVLVVLLRMDKTPYASVYMTINPEVRIDVDKNETVIHVEGINDDGKMLLANYPFENKHLDIVMDELVDRAIEMDYLHEGGAITVTLDAEDTQWINQKETVLETNINKHIENKVPSVSVTAKPHHESDYGDSDYADSPYGDSGYDEAPEGDSGYDEAPEGDSGYDEDADDEDIEDEDIDDEDDDGGKGNGSYGDTDYDEQEEPQIPDSSEITDYDGRDKPQISDAPDATDYDEPQTSGDVAVTDYDEEDYSDYDTDEDEEE